MDAMSTLMTAVGGPETLVMGLAFLAVALTVVGLAGLLPANVGARRLKRGTRASGRDSSAGLDALAERLAPLGRDLAPKTEGERRQVRLKLLRAGYSGRNAVSVYYALRLGLALVLPAVLVPLLPVLTRHMSVTEIVALGAVLLAAGFYLPAAVVAWKAREREYAVRVAFPDALDLMLVCVEAGMGLDAAINRVADELRTPHPVLAEHLATAGLELRAGAAREDALRNLATRTGVAEVNAFSTMLIQSQELGTSIGESLRVYSDDMRYRRMMAAEEKAQKLPAKMILPMALFLLPAFVVMLMLPAVIRVMTALFPALEG